MNHPFRDTFVKKFTHFISLFPFRLVLHWLKRNPPKSIILKIVMMFQKDHLLYSALKMPRCSHGPSTTAKLQGCKSSGRAGRAGLSGPAQLKSRAVAARPAKILGRNGPAQLKSWAGPGRSYPILFLSVFLKDFLKKIWTLLLTHFKLSIVLSKNGGISAKS